MKKYRLPSDYMSWSNFQKHYEALESITPKKFTIYDTDLQATKVAATINRNMAWQYQQWGKGYPVYCVRESLLWELNRTDVGNNIPLFSDVDLALPTYMLVFPQGTVKSPSNKGNAYVDYVIINHETLDNPEYKHLFLWCGIDSSAGAFLSSKRIRRDGALNQSCFSNHNEESKKNALELRNLVLQSILLLQYYPEIIEDIKDSRVLTGKIKGFSKGELPTRDYLLPRWLGSDHKEYIKNNVSDSSGTKKAPHLRRGFYRVQPCGQGRKDSKVIRIAPTWIHKDEL